jgi:hypothetical protein
MRAVTDPLPRRPRRRYPWIHPMRRLVILMALLPLRDLASTA